jgi:hypothetical protein
LRGGGKVKFIKKVNDRLARRDSNILTDSIVNRLSQCVEQLNINVLLLCPQTLVDLTVGRDLAKKTSLPMVTWFMDDYFTSNGAATLVHEVLRNTHAGFVISEAMQQHFKEVFGVDFMVLNNSVDFPASCPRFNSRNDTSIRLAYTGSLHSYYIGAMTRVLDELQGLEGKVELDLYSHEVLPERYLKNTNSQWHCRRPIAAGELTATLQKYDALLMLSSFELEHVAIAKTSLASKFADYLAAGRCIIAFGPEYAENIKYVRKYGLGVTVTSNSPGDLKQVLLGLIREPERLSQFGSRAFDFGKRTRDRQLNRQLLWSVLSSARECALPSNNQMLMR